ncbi:MAG: hypothetical protein LGR52_10660 [Candidatus Thiosymbion ectosymbiont of Robbea hypermnestra]|nr:hypothetical protein [Candidatus Thiosymbion ectosymbiont of Robbea hypermnestra]
MQDDRLPGRPSIPSRSLRAVGSGLRTGWLILGLLLLLILAGEAGLRLILTAGDRLAREPRTGRWLDERARADAYHGATWVQDYFRELDLSGKGGWRPYVYWRHPPRRGRYIQVDRNGLRATWRPPSRDAALDAPPPVRIFAFGASTMWGLGVRDHYTVASHLSKRLHARGYPAQVTNYGQSAYVSTQEAIALLRGIHRGEVPDIVIFYDGLSDVLSSYMNAAAGVSQNARRRRAEFALLDRPQGLLQHIGRQVPTRNLWGFDRLATGLRRGIRPSVGHRSQVRPLSDEVVRQTRHIYAANLAFVASLGRRYGFESLFYWQPHIFSKRRRSASEQAAAESLFPTRKAFEAIYREVRRSATLRDQTGFRDISALFDDLAEPYYVDGTHLSESGNRLVAEVMAEDVIDLIEQR